MGGAWITNGMMPFFMLLLGSLVSALGFMAVWILLDIRGDIERLTTGQSALNEKLHAELSIIGTRHDDYMAELRGRVGRLEGHCRAGERVAARRPIRRSPCCSLRAHRRAPVRSATSCAMIDLGQTGRTIPTTAIWAVQSEKTMNPLDAAGALAMIVGLLSNFKAEQSGTELTEFTKWLKEKHREEVTTAIERNATLSNEISTILATNHGDLVDRLAQLNSQFAQIASKVEGFGGLVNALNFKAVISEQAIVILRQLVDSGAKYFIEHKIYTGEPDEYQLIGGAGGKVAYADRRFVKDDLNSLVAADLLRLEFTSKGSRKFFVTRAAAEFFK